MGGGSQGSGFAFAEFKTGSVQDGARCRGEEQPCGHPPFTVQPENIPPGCCTLLQDASRLITHMQLDQRESQPPVIMQLLQILTEEHSSLC